MEKLKKDIRSQFLITNANIGVPGRNRGNEVYVIELPRLIVDGAGRSICSQAGPVFSATQGNA